MHKACIPIRYQESVRIISVAFLNHHHIRAFAFRTFRSISPYDLLRNSFTLSLQLSEEPKI